MYNLNVSLGWRRCRWLVLLFVAALLPLLSGGLLLGVLPATAAPEPPPLTPGLLATHGGADADDDGKPIHVQLTVGLLADKPVDTPLLEYCPPQAEIEAGPGEMIAFCYRMQNDSDIIFTRHTVVDSIFGIILENVYYPVTPTNAAQAVVPIAASATRTNAMTWTAYADNGDSVSDFASAAVIVPTLALTATASPDPTVCGDAVQLELPAPGDVTFCFHAHNPTPYPLIAHQVVDADGSPLQLPADLILAPGASYHLTTTAFVTEPVQHRITWTAQTATRSIPVTATATTAVRLPHIDVTVALARSGGVCRSGDLAVSAGTPVVFCLTASNDGSVPFTAHRVVAPALDLDFSFPYSLTPASAINLTFTRTVTTTLASQVTWAALWDDRRSVSDTVQGNVFVVAPGAIEVAVWLAAQTGDAPIGVPNISIALIDPDGASQTRLTDSAGRAYFAELIPGIYTLQIITSALGSGLRLISPDTITATLAARSTIVVEYLVTGTLSLQALHLPLVLR